MASMMDEMQKTLARRRAKVENRAANDDVSFPQSNKYKFCSIRYIHRADQKNLSTFEFAAIFLPLFLSSNDRKQKSVEDKDKKEENPKK